MLFEDKLIKFICIETPHTSRFNKKFIKKDYLCEKPLLHNRKALNKIKSLLKVKIVTL